LQLPDMGSLAGGSETGWLFHELHLLFWQNAIQERCLHIVLVSVPIVAGSNV